MTRPCPAHIRLVAALALLALPVGVAGCFNPFSPRLAPVLGHSTPAPVPNSPSNLLRLFEWCYNNRAITEYRELFTDDYRFVFDPVDSTGKEYSGTPWTREDELISTTHLFVGGSADLEPATRITMRLDQNFFVSSDPNYLKWDPQGRWHKNIRTQIQFNYSTESGDLEEVSGAASFYLVRGDSALIPQELRLLGFGPDPNRWYVRQLNDETAHPEVTMALTAGGALRVPSTASADRSAGPARSALALGDPPIVVSWGYVKAYYRGPRTALTRTTALPAHGRASASRH